MNSVQLIGRVTAPPELRHTNSGKAVANASLAVDDGYGDKKTTLFIGLTFWDKSAEAAAQHLVKGQRIGVTGRLSQEEYTPKGSDKPVRKTHVTVVAFDFLDKPHDRAAEPRQSSHPEPTPPADGLDDSDDSDDDIPF